MSPSLLDIMTLLTFVAACAAGWGLLQAYERRFENQRHRIREHLVAMLDLAATQDDEQQDKPDLQQVFRRQHGKNSWLAKWIDARRKRLLTVCQGREKLFLAVILVIALLVETFLLWMLPTALASKFLIMLAAPAVVLILGYRFMVARFRKHFLAQFPNALDLIIRAVRAGVPASHAITVAGQEFTEPLRTQFGMMGDGLRLGIDLREVLNDADRRIDIPEFSFFCVCMLLQRETGGPLTETLENLAQIIRARIEMALKAKALTAEVRTASKVMAVIPFGIVAVVGMLNPDYITPLFTTDGGILMLKLAICLIAIGLAIIYRLADVRP